ncbi:MAG: tripartite tricarboxylate transporter permease, partial [Thermoguttaceae bacterium]|nr:tripartite tricarboxylate transporter permease [Thermoguttaceae bacterium]
FGIPGDSVTAIVMGVLLMKNIKPGPEIFEKQAVLVYSIFLIFFLANFILIGVGFLAVKAGGYVVRIPRRILLPVILLFCVIGSYAINGSYFDIGVMLVMGGFGFALERRQIPLGPVVLGIILGGPLEERFIQTLSSSASAWDAFFSRPMAAALGITAILVWLAPVVVSLLAARRLPSRAK